MPDNITKSGSDFFDGAGRRNTGQATRAAKHQRRHRRQPSDSSDDNELFRQALAERDDNELFHQALAERDGTELFRQALAERDEVAQTLISTIYHNLVEQWVCTSAGFEASGERSETLVDEAFARFWHAISPERFEQFPNERVLLHYLRLCARCVVIDSARAAARLASAEVVSLNDTRQCVPDEEVIESLRREELWRNIDRQLSNDAERVAIFESFVAGLLPRTIQARHPDLFADVRDVYRVKRNVIERLRRDQGMRGFLEGDSKVLPEEALPRGVIDEGAERLQDNIGTMTEDGFDCVSAGAGPIAADPVLKSAVAAGFEIWLDRAEQHERSSDVVDAAANLRRYYCGRWIVLRGIQQGLTTAKLVETTSLDQQTLLLLESGMTKGTIDSESQKKLSGVLANAGDHAAWVADVVAIACGQAVPHAEQVMERVMIDIQPILAEPGE